MANLTLDIIRERPLLFDGAMGTMLMKAGQGSLKTPILLNLDEPDLVTDIHRQYYAAGADVVITNTFGGSPLKLVADGLEPQMVELNREAVKLTRHQTQNRILLVRNNKGHPRIIPLVRLVLRILFSSKCRRRLR